MALNGTAPRLYSRQFAEIVTIVILELLLIDIEAHLAGCQQVAVFLRPLIYSMTHLIRLH